MKENFENEQNRLKKGMFTNEERRKGKKVNVPITLYT